MRIFILLIRSDIVGGNQNRDTDILKTLKQRHNFSGQLGIQDYLSAHRPRSIFGLCTTARAIPTRCCSPPESSMGSAFLCRADRHYPVPRAPCGRSRRGITRHLQWQGDIFKYRAIKQQLVILENHTELAAIKGNSGFCQAVEVFAINQQIARGWALDKH